MAKKRFSSTKKLLSVVSISNPHDVFFKETLTDIQAATQFFELYLPKSLQARCKLATLKLAPGTFIDSNLRQHLSDVLYSVELDKQQGYFYCLVEHVSQAKPITAFQVLRYQIAAMHQHMKQGHDKPPIIIPIVFYRGEKSPYPESCDPFECFEDPELARQTLLQPHILVDLTIIPDEELETHKAIGLMEILQKHISQRDMLELREYVTIQKLHVLSRDQQKAVLKYIVVAGRYRNDEEFVQWFQEQAKNAGDLELMQTLSNHFTQKGIEQGMQAGMQAGLAEGMQQGMQQGMQAGVERTSRTIAEKMRALGADETFIKAALADIG